MDTYIKNSLQLFSSLAIAAKGLKKLRWLTVNLCKNYFAFDTFVNASQMAGHIFMKLLWNRAIQTQSISQNFHTQGTGKLLTIYSDCW